MKSDPVRVLLLVAWLCWSAVLLLTCRCSRLVNPASAQGWHAEFLDMWRTSGFTDRKLRIRMPAPNTGDYPAMPAPAAKL